MSQIADLGTAIVAILKADTDTAAEVGTRVFGDEMPRSEVDDEPRKTVVVVTTGGVIPPYAAGTVPLEVQRLDIWCYGKNMLEADGVRRAVFGAMRGINRTLAAGVLVHWARPAGGAAQGRDPDGDWPYKWNSWQVMADERAAS